MNGINISRTIEYTYPDLGLVKIVLQKESAEIYNFLKIQKEGIEYFENLDQLGGLRAVHKSAHHSRWEYMIFQMYLIQQLKQASAFGFSTSILLTPQIRISSIEELLKSWVLLNNYGHLLNTIEAERVWFEIIQNNDKIYQKFNECMPDNTSKELAKHVFNNSLLYQFHHLIALVFLNNAREQQQIEAASTWIEMTKSLLRDVSNTHKPKEGSKLSRALSVFNLIRRAYYTLFDINRSTLFLRIDPNNMLRNILANPDMFLYEPDSEINATISSIEKLLFSEVYANIEVCSFKRHYIDGQKEHFSTILDKHGLGLYCKNTKIFATQLYKAKMNNFGKYKIHDSIKHVTRIHMLPEYPFERNSCNYLVEQNKINSLLSSEGISLECLITPAPYSEAGSILDLFSSNRLKANEISFTFFTLLEYVLECYKDWAFDNELSGYVMNVPIQEIFVFLLSCFIKNPSKIRFISGTSPRDYNVDVIDEHSNKRKWSMSFSTSTKDKKFAKDRKWELDVVKKIILKPTNGIVLSAISNIRLYASDGTSKVEWDGCVLVIEKTDVVLYLIEAKQNETRSSHKCESCLLDSINEAGIFLKSNNLKFFRGTGFAYTKIRLTEC